MQEYTYW